MREPEQNSASEVPKWALDIAVDLMLKERGHTSKWHMAFARYIAVHEPEPVDPLREAVQAAILEADRDHAEGTTWIDDFVKALRAHGATMGKNNG